MSREELKPKDKVVMRMGKDGAVEENLTQGTEHRVSARPEDIPFVQPEEPSQRQSFDGKRRDAAEHPSLFLCKYPFCFRYFSCSSLRWAFCLRYRSNRQYEEHQI